MNIEGEYRNVCPSCGGSQFHQRAIKTTGYWAGHVIVPIVCSHCSYDVGYGFLDALPSFKPPTSKPADIRNSPKDLITKKSKLSNSMGIIKRFLPSDTKIDKPFLQTRQINGKDSGGIYEWIILFIFTLVLVAVYYAIASNSG